jgi:hypothetical protein
MNASSPDGPDLLPVCRCLYGRLGPVAARSDAPFWQAIAPVELRETVSGDRPLQGSRVRAAWDDAGWRLLFEMDDAHPWATMTQRDSQIWLEEAAEVFFDPVGDLEGYFEVQINPLGTVTDLVLRRTRSGWKKNFAWAVEGLESCARQTDLGWCAELSIPFAALGPERPVPGTRWRVNFLRIDRPDGPGTEAELSAWSPTGMRQFHRAERFGFLEFQAAEERATPSD